MTSKSSLSPQEFICCRIHGQVLEHTSACKTGKLRDVPFPRIAAQHKAGVRNTQVPQLALRFTTYKRVASPTFLVIYHSLMSTVLLYYRYFRIAYIRQLGLMVSLTLSSGIYLLDQPPIQQNLFRFPSPRSLTGVVVWPIGFELTSMRTGFIHLPMALFVDHRTSCCHGVLIA